MNSKYLIIPFLAFLSFNSFSQDVPTIDIMDAIDKKTIDYKAGGKYNIEDKSEYTDADGQYYGKSMIIILINNSNDSIYIYIEEGLMLMSENPDVQDMVITKPVYALLRPKGRGTFPLYAMCSEIHDGVPNTQIAYKLKKNNDKELVAIAQTINRSYMQNVIGQGAVWARTDNALEADLKKYGATDETLELTLSLLAKAGVTTKLAEELSYTAPVKTEENKDSIILMLNNHLLYANTVLKYKAEKMEMAPVIVYSGIGVIVLLIGTTAYFASRKRKGKSDLT